MWDTWGPDPGMPIQARGVSVWRDGYSIQVTSYNSADRYDESSVLSAAPLLSVDQMLIVAKSRVWFR